LAAYRTDLQLIAPISSLSRKQKKVQIPLIGSLLH
jgi:hypothetical protein